MQTNHFAIPTDSRYWPGTTAVVHSIVRHTSRPVCIHVTAREVPGAEQWARRWTKGRVTCRVYDVSGEMAEADWARWPGMHQSKASLDRLLLTRLLPEVERVLYIDADCVALRPLDG